MTDHERAWIDKATFDQLYNKLHHEPINSPWFTGDTGEYFMKVYQALKSLTPSAERIRISKKAWEGKKMKD